MSYDFYCQSSGGSDNNSGSSKDSPDWTGTVNCSGNTTLTRASGSAWTSALVGEFVRIDPGGGDDSNLRISAFVDSSTLTLAENGPSVTGATANVGGAFATIQEADDNIPTYASGSSVDADMNLYLMGSWTLSAFICFDNNKNTYDTGRRRIISDGLSSWGDGNRANINLNGSYALKLNTSLTCKQYSLIGLEIQNGLVAMIQDVNGDGLFCYDCYIHDILAFGFACSGKAMILNCEVEDCGMTAITIASHGATVGNYVHNASRGTAIGIKTSGGFAAHNEVKGCQYGIEAVLGSGTIYNTIYDCDYAFYPYKSSGGYLCLLMNNLLDGDSGAIQDPIQHINLGNKGRNGSGGQDDMYHPYPSIEDYDNGLEDLSSAVLAIDSEWWNSGWRTGKPSTSWANAYTSPGAIQKKNEMGMRRTRGGVYANPKQMIGV